MQSGCGCSGNVSVVRQQFGLEFWQRQLGAWSGNFGCSCWSACAGFMDEVSMQLCGCGSSRCADTGGVTVRAQKDMHLLFLCC